MAASGFTPISLYYSTTASAVPTSGNLANGELGLNIADMKLYAKNSAGTVTLLASSGGATGTVSSVAATVPAFLSITGSPITTSGTLAISLSGSALPTTSGGTGLTSFNANGVVYASSSSVLATSSALTFDGTSLSTTGQVLLENNKYIGFKNTTGTYAASIFNDTSNFLNLFNSGNTGTIFYVNAAEQMRLTSTGLGIGTNSPQAKLQVLDQIKVSSSDQSSGIVALGDGSSTSVNVGIGRWNGTTNAAGTGGMGYFSQGTVNSGGHYFYTGDAAAGSQTERFRFATQGQLGIGGANYGTAGQVLTSGGSGAAPTWTTAAGGSQAFVAFGSTGGL